MWVWRARPRTEETCFVGVSFHHLRTTRRHIVYSSVAQAFSSDGEGFALRGEAERDERRRRDRERLAEATRALLSSEGWTAWLHARATLHAYSLRNTLLIAQEGRRRGFTPTYVAGFKAWLKLGRSVRKAERGIAILAPVRVNERDREGEETGESRVFFRTAYVFDVSQTDPLPGVEPTPLDPPRAPIEGDSHAGLLEPLEALAAELGYAVCYRELERVDGLCDYRARRISVAVRLAPNGRVAVLVHELAHALAGREAGLAKQLEELVVDAIAFIVCAGAGLDTGADSVPYIAGWAGDDALEQLQKAAELIDDLARRIEQAIAPADVADHELLLGAAGQLLSWWGCARVRPQCRPQAGV
jgi:antirestriction protein ArdC